MAALAMAGRWYIRLGVDLPARKADYSDAAFRAFVVTLCVAARQDPRGIFESEPVLRAFLGRRLGRYVPELVANHDLERLGDGRIYVANWHEWQEGDVTAGERMRRLRERRRAAASVTEPVTDNGVTPVTDPVTDPVTADRRGTSTYTDNKDDPGVTRVPPEVAAERIDRVLARSRAPSDPPAVFMGFRQKGPPAVHAEDAAVDPGEPEEARRERMRQAIRSAPGAYRDRLIASYERLYGEAWDAKDEAPRDKSTGDASSGEG